MANQNTAHAGGGQAREWKRGRLAGFEDADSNDDLAGLIRRRTRPADPPPPAQPDTTTPTAVDTDTDTSKTVESESPQSTTAPPAKAKRPRKKTAAPKPEVVPENKSAIRNSSVHVPASLVERIVAERQRTGRSNGEVVIAAIEHAHPQLAELIGKRQSGGTLFTPRASRNVRSGTGPLTPLNVRLRQADYEVIDQLVEDFGAFSRGHLVTVALTHYLETDSS